MSTVRQRNEEMEYAGDVYVIADNGSGPGRTESEYIGRTIYRFIKRLSDITFSLIALIALSPVMLLVTVMIAVTDGGPVFYTQDRMGEGRKSFKMYKFRSMYINADKEFNELKQNRECKIIFFKDKNDPRITPIGRFIRRYDIDELPQLINILRGEMSIVGPRPLPVYEAEALKDRYTERYSVPQGLTCYWQVSDRRNVTDQERMVMDVRYSKDACMLEDFKLVFKTVRVVLRGQGEY